MPKTEKQFEQIRKEKKELILETALELFAENGFHATSINQIAKKAGISKGLTYNYFESKNDILTEIVDNGFHEIHDLFDLNADGILTEEEFIFFIEKTFDIIKNNLRHWKLFFSLMLQPIVSDNFMEKYTEAGKSMLKMMHDFLEKKGCKDPQGDMLIINSMLEGAFIYAIVAPEMFPIDKMKKKIVEGIFRIINTNDNQVSSL